MGNANAARCGPGGVLLGSGLCEPRLDEGDQVARPVADAPRADLDRPRAVAVPVLTFERRDRNVKELRRVRSRAETVRLGLAKSGREEGC